ncbi:MAG: serine/threonine protein kinase [Myxococcales bacterium]|nr:MAG: serine/threonine protein kinase [Myxococcales bacterium]
MSKSNELSFDLENEEQAPEVVSGSERNFGEYQLRYQIASGGMGTVYLARDFGPAGFVRPVALKRIHPHLAKRRKFVDMFLDEARIISRVSHPNVCRIFDFGKVSGTYYMAMEYLVGESLAGVMNAMVKEPERFDEPKWHALACRMIADAAEGLHAAHELVDENGKALGVVHRDVSPHNLFVNYDGSVRVLDFGVAFATERLHQSTTGTVKGKYAYMAPEQIKTRDFDRRADIWALGVCLWEMLTAHRLFRRDSEVDTILAVGSLDVEAPSAHRPNIPKRLDRVVLSALKRDPESRYDTARDFGRDLLEVVNEIGQSAGPAELSDWLRQLFREQRAEKLHRVETVMEAHARSPGPTVHERETKLEQSSPPSSGAGFRGLFSKKNRGLSGLVLATGLGLVLLGLALGRTFAAQTHQRTTELDIGLRAVAPVPLDSVEAFGLDLPKQSTLKNDEKSNVPRRSESKIIMGYVNIVTPGGWADIYEGKRFLGRTTKQICLGTGTHVLELRAFGKTPKIMRPVTVGADRVTRVVVSLHDASKG